MAKGFAAFRGLGSTKAERDDDSGFWWWEADEPGRS